MTFKFHYPERGRKPSKFSFGAKMLRTCVRSNSITPKGDGNVVEVLLLVQACALSGFKFHYPERGRKLQVQDLPAKLEVAKFKFHYPERGRKRL